MKRLGGIGVAVGAGFGGEGAEGAVGFAVGDVPDQAVVLAGRADEFLGVLLDGGAVMEVREVFLLGVGHGVERIHGAEFVIADAAGQDFGLGDGAVVKPLAGEFLVRGMGNGRLAAPVVRT